MAADGDPEEDDVAIQDVWHSWCRAPDEGKWDLLCQWRDAAELTEAACAAALAQLVSAGEVGDRLPRAAFCVDHGLAPADPPQRVLFYLLTGQEEQRRAADPDGSLTARAYATADDDTRAVLRRALARSGGLDLVRVIAGSGPGRRGLAPEERAYLAARLRSRRDWAGLWLVVRDMPVGEAVGWLPRFGDGWHPAADHDRGLFGLLRRADPLRVAAGLAVIGARSSRVETGGRLIRSGALSGDGWRLAVVSPTRPEYPADRQQAVITEFDVSTGAVTAEFCLRPPPGAVTAGYLEGTLAVADATYRGGYPDGAVYRLSGGHLVPLSGEVRPAHGTFVGPVFSPPGGIGVLEANRVRLHARDGTLAAAIGLGALGSPVPGRAPRAFAVGPDGLLAVLGYAGLAVYDTREPGDARLVGRAEIERPMTACFTARGHVVAKGLRSLQAWRAGPAGLELAAWSADGADSVRSFLAAIPGSDMIAMVRPSGHVVVRDARTLRDVPVPDWVPSRQVDQMWGACGDACSALVTEDSVVVLRDVHPAAAIADRPASEWSSADLPTMTAAVADPALHPAARPLAELLRDCLDWRFGAEVRIGMTGPLPRPVPLGADDIVLAPDAALGGGDGPC
jgi:hypothetical protein